MIVTFHWKLDETASMGAIRNGRFERFPDQVLLPWPHDTLPRIGESVCLPLRHVNPHEKIPGNVFIRSKVVYLDWDVEATPHIYLEGREFILPPEGAHYVPIPWS